MIDVNKLNDILERYKYIKKHYNIFLNGFSKTNHPLIDLIANERGFLKVFDGQLKRLDRLEDLSHLIKNSKNPKDFYPTVSVIKIISHLINNVDDISIIVPHKSSPDFKIKKSNVEITVEVKKIAGKLEKSLSSSKDRDIYCGEDINTLYNTITESIKKGQYYQGVPHIFILDCGGGILEDEIEPILYTPHDTKVSLNNKQDSSWHFVNYKGLFLKKNDYGKYLYPMISGVVAIFEGDTVSGKTKNEIITKCSRKTFFENPNSSNKIPKSVIESLGFLFIEKNDFQHKN